MVTPYTTVDETNTELRRCVVVAMRLVECRCGCGEPFAESWFYHGTGCPKFFAAVTQIAEWERTRVRASGEE
jgi:SH3-like domain-containing protein